MTKAINKFFSSAGIFSNILQNEMKLFNAKRSDDVYMNINDKLLTPYLDTAKFNSNSMSFDINL